MKKQSFEGFYNLYSKSKTLRFELIPVGKTLERINQKGIIEDDFHKADSYKIMKKIIDQYHKKFIDEVLTDLKLDNLDQYQMFYCMNSRTESEEKEFLRIQADLRKQIAQKFNSNSKFKTLFKKEFIKEELKAFVIAQEAEDCIIDKDEEFELIKEFQGYTTYFNGFNENRKNMYSADEKSTAISYRLIYQNLPKYIDNLKIFEKLENSEFCVKINMLNAKLKDKIGIGSIFDFFQLDGFNKVLTQEGIEFYNTILGAYSEKKNFKEKGINEYINEYNQHVNDKKQRFPLMKPLFKQILSDKETVSYVSENFSDDQEVCTALNKYGHILIEQIFHNSNGYNLCDLFENIEFYRLDGIYIKNDKTITDISRWNYGDWSTIPNAIGRAYDKSMGEKVKHTQKYDEKKEKEIKKRKCYSIQELNNYLDEENVSAQKVESYFQNQVDSIAQEIRLKWVGCKDIVEKTYPEQKELRRNDEDISIIKTFLDSIKHLQSVIKPLCVGNEEAGRDELFYSELNKVVDILDESTELYNRVRNYVTKKSYSLEKIKLNFNNSTLLDGWDVNKERDNLGVFLIKDGKYYLGIMDKAHNKVMEDAPGSCIEKSYQKVEYKLLPGPNKMLPKVFFSDSRREDFQPDSEILRKYKAETHIKGESFILEDCHQLIDFFKQSIEKHEDWKKFDFHFSDTNTYNDISGFYREVEKQGYKITFRNIDADYIDQLVEDGKLYLFQIYNKDFSEYSKGKKNLHTMYFEKLFDESNLKDVVYKLNGQAEVFFRKASLRLNETTIHKKNELLINKDPQNEKKTSIFLYDIVKDRRFTCDKFQLNLPITMNFKADGEKYFNKKVRHYIHDTEDLHIIGIDRGERNLLYLSVIDLVGNIVDGKQLSLNEIISTDIGGTEHRRNYHNLLDIREKKNKEARQAWTTIDTIKDLKEGYISQVIHVITDLMLQYNAIVVMEDLNFGFMRSRQKIEKQVYQKFEKMLIEKLNYLVCKDRNDNEPGGLMHAYQLTNEFESFQKLGKQSGFLFYVPAWMTSKIDPTTGFVNLFYEKYESVEKSKAFVSKFENIYYDEIHHWFAFQFDYSNFTSKAEGSKTVWTVCSYGKRIQHFRNIEKNSSWDTREVDLTDEFEKLFKDYHLDLTSNNMICALLKVDEKNFWEKFIQLFNLMLQMRNSDEQRKIDQLISPVQNAEGKFFISGENSLLPLDADANGAYNIAKKGLWIVEKIKEIEPERLDKVNLAIKNSEWLKFAQERLL